MKKVAQIISTVGNPLLTIPLIVEILLLKHGDKKILAEMSLVIGCLFALAILWIFIKFKRGAYSDFDVSKRKERFSLYLFIIPLVFACAYIFYILEQPAFVYIAFITGGGLMTASFVSNFFIKSSLHSSLNLYLAISVIIIDFQVGIFLLAFTALVGWSRVFLKKHTLNEVFSGMLIGVSSGILLFYFTLGKV